MNFWKNASPATKKSVYVMTIIFSLLIIIVPTVWVKNTETAASRMNGQASSKDNRTSDDLIIDIRLSSVNTDDYTYTLIMKLKPTGQLANQAGNLTRYNAQIDLSIKGQRFSFGMNSPAAVIEFQSNFLMGTSNSYPFDVYSDEFDISGILLNRTGNQFLNIQAAYIGTFDSFDANLHVSSFSSKSTVSLTIERTGTTKFFSIAVVLLMWALSFTILTLSVTIWIRKRIVEPPTIAVAAGLLFAIPQLRNVQPGIPSIGCAMDALGFFWNMALIASSLLLLMWNYIIYKRDQGTIYNGSEVLASPSRANLPGITTTYPRKVMQDLAV